MIDDLALKRAEKLKAERDDLMMRCDGWAADMAGMVSQAERLMAERDHARAAGQDLKSKFDLLFAELVLLKVQNETLRTIASEAHAEGWDDGRMSINGSQFHYWRNSRSRRKLEELK